MQDEASPFFTTPHFDGHPSVLLRGSRIGELDPRGAGRGGPGRLAVPRLDAPGGRLAPRPPSGLSVGPRSHPAPGGDRARTARHDGGVTGTHVQPPQSPTENATMPGPAVEQRIAEELGVRERQVAAAVELLDGGATVPFIARYRKEATGCLDDAQLRTLEERLRYLRELEERRGRDPRVDPRAGQARRRAARRRSWRPTPRRGWRTSTCRTSRSGAPRRRSPARPGLEPLADALLGDPTLDPHGRGRGFVDAEKGVADAAAALDGARAILVERFAEDADLIGELRERMWTAGPARRHGPRRARRRRAPSSPTTSTSPSRSPSCPRTGSWPCSAARRRRSSTSTIEPDGPTPSDAADRPDRLRARRSPRRFGIADRGRPGRQVAAPTPSAGPGAPGSSSTSASTCGCGCAQAAEDEAVAGVRRQPARPAARRAGRHPRHDGPRPGLPHRREGRRGRRHRQGRRHRHDLPARAAAPAGTSRWPRWRGWPARTASS